MSPDDDAKLQGDDLAATLSLFSNEELAPIYALLTRPLSEMLSVDPRVKVWHPAHSAYSDLIARHLRRFGGNTFANMGRGSEGPAYQEIVRDVCRSRKVTVPKGGTAVQMEQALLADLFAMLPEEDKALILSEAAARYGYSAELLGPATLVGLMATQASARMAGFVLYRTGLQVMNVVSRLALRRGLSVAGNQVLGRLLGTVSGPIGWTLSGVMAARNIASPALRVTTPCVLLVAGTRQAKLWRQDMGIAA